MSILKSNLKLKPFHMGEIIKAKAITRMSPEDLVEEFNDQMIEFLEKITSKDVEGYDDDPHVQMLEWEEFKKYRAMYIGQILSDNQNMGGINWRRLSIKDILDEREQMIIDIEEFLQEIAPEWCDFYYKIGDEMGVGYYFTDEIVSFIEDYDLSMKDMFDIQDELGYSIDIIMGCCLGVSEYDAEFLLNQHPEKYTCENVPSSLEESDERNFYRGVYLNDYKTIYFSEDESMKARY